MLLISIHIKLHMKLPPTRAPVKMNFLLWRFTKFQTDENIVAVTRRSGQSAQQARLNDCYSLNIGSGKLIASWSLPPWWSDEGQTASKQEVCSSPLDYSCLVWSAVPRSTTHVWCGPSPTNIIFPFGCCGMVFTMKVLLYLHF